MRTWGLHPQTPVDEASLSQGAPSPRLEIQAGKTNTPEGTQVFKMRPARGPSEKPGQATPTIAVYKTKDAQITVLRAFKNTTVS
ncbi:hypothetical protein ES703_108498 [subsurface metagenome]